MSTDLRPPNSPNPTASRTPPDPTEEKKKVFDLSMTQVAGGALAAMTAAALGSTLGVAGTIVGAALASVVAGVAGSLYTASLRTGREKVRTVFRGQSTDAGSAPPAPVDPATTFVARRGPRRRRQRPRTRADPGPSRVGSAAAGEVISDEASTGAVPLEAGGRGQPVRVRTRGRPDHRLRAGQRTAAVRRHRDDRVPGRRRHVIRLRRREHQTTRAQLRRPPALRVRASSTPTASTSPAIGTEPSASESGKSPSPSASESTPESAAPSVADGAGERLAGDLARRARPAAARPLRRKLGAHCKFRSSTVQFAPAFGSGPDYP